MTLDPLRRAAEARGIATRFTDAAGNDHRVADATLRAVLDAFGEEPPTRGAWPPVVVARVAVLPPREAAVVHHHGLWHVGGAVALVGDQVVAAHRVAEH
ncbi:MAG TPA: hypothetical protein VF880_07240, partial [Actinomycetes bacterium]